MKVILFGATGYLGSHVAEQLVLAGHQIDCFVRRASNNAFLQQLKAAHEGLVNIVEVDFNQTAALEAVIPAGATVVNCIAETRLHLGDEQRRKVEVDLTGRLFSVAQRAGAERFLQLSTVMVYGFDRPASAVSEDYPCRPEYSYGKIALEREDNLVALQKNGDTQLVILRPSNTMGKRDSSALPSLLQSLKQGKFPVIGGGDWVFSCMDARDVGRAMAHLLSVETDASDIYLAKGFDTTWLEVKAALDNKLGSDSTLMNVPKKLALCLGWLMEKITPYGKMPALTRFSAAVVSTDTLFDDQKIRASGFVPLYGLESMLDEALD